MFIEATSYDRRRSTVLINTDQIVSVESRLLFLDIDYRVTMSNGKQFIVEDDAKRQLRSIINAGKHAGGILTEPPDLSEPVDRSDHRVFHGGHDYGSTDLLR